MLIQFSIKNFLSFKEEQCLSMVAGRYSELPDNVFTPKSGGKELSLLRSAVLYGANAAGKSSLLIAMSIMQDIVRDSVLPSKIHLQNVIPFLFDDTFAKQPSEFEAVFIADGVRYQYGFSATRERIFDEWLFAFPQGRQQRWFERYYDSATDSYKWEFGANLLGEKELWKKSTRPAALFLSTAVNLNSEQLKPIADWFVDRCRFMAGIDWENSSSATEATRLLLKSGKVKKESVRQYLNRADLDIADFNIKDHDIITTHETPSVKKELSIGLESSGTKKMFALAGPWIDSLEHGHTLFLDELSAHLHPHLSGYLVKMFYDPKRNKSGAQLIFTTHDSTVLSKDIFRRDQIWFCEKNKEQATELYSLADIQSRKNENREAFYLSGRYGAVPFVK